MLDVNLEPNLKDYQILLEVFELDSELWCLTLLLLKTQMGLVFNFTFFQTINWFSHLSLTTQKQRHQFFGHKVQLIHTNHPSLPVDARPCFSSAHFSLLFLSNLSFFMCFKIKCRVQQMKEFIDFDCFEQQKYNPVHLNIPSDLKMLFSKQFRVFSTPLAFRIFTYWRFSADTPVRIAQIQTELFKIYISGKTQQPKCTPY